MEYFMPVSVGLIQVFFFSKLANKLFDEKDKQNCLELDFKTDEYKKCQKKNDEKNEKRDSKKFIFMIAVATIVFIIVSQLNTTNDVKFGTGLGAFFMIIYALFMNWSQMNETMKLGVLGTTFCILLYGASKTNI
jgi:predicted histidine transporter YuiF (NhaC family)